MADPSGRKRSRHAAKPPRFVNAVVIILTLFHGRLIHVFTQMNEGMKRRPAGTDYSCQSTIRFEEAWTP